MSKERETSSGQDPSGEGGSIGGVPRGARGVRDGRVPVRTIAATIGMVLVTAAAIWLLVELSRVLAWLVIAAFFAVVLSPTVSFLQRRARMPRPLATLTALLGLLVLLAGVVTVLVRPLVSQVQHFVAELPSYLRRVQNGEGLVGGLIRRYDIVDLVQQNQERIRDSATQLGDPALNVVVAAGNVVVGILVVVVLAFLLTLEGPKLVNRAVALLPGTYHDRAHRICRDSARAVTGYVSGQLLIATLCGVLTFVVLTIMRVPFAGVVALFVGVMGLIPVVGATLGGLVGVGVAFVHTITAGIVVLIFFLVYQQVENHMLQPVIQARTVHLNALGVLVSVLIGVELAGILGALLAIPAAGMVKVIVIDLWPQRQGGAAGEASSEQPPPASPNRGQTMPVAGEGEDMEGDTYGTPSVKER